MEINNGLSGFDLDEHHDGLFYLYRFDLTINGSTLYVGTAAQAYCEQAAAQCAGYEWMEFHRRLYEHGDHKIISRIVSGLS